MTIELRRDCDLVVAVAGAPNVGKTSLFNVLTGRAERVANWPGVTVELKTAIVRVKGVKVCLVDLPGTYGLSGVGAEERIARDFIINAKPDVILVLADSTNLERTLYLPLEVLEYTGRVVVALTKSDAAQEKGVRIDVEGLSRELGVPVVLTSAIRGIGIDELVEAILAAAKSSGKPLRIDYGVAEEYVKRVEKILSPTCPGLARWLAIRLLEGLEWAEQLCQRLCGDACRDAVKVAEASRREFREKFGRELSTEIIAKRFELIERLVEKYTARPTKTARLERLDRVFLHPILGPIAATLTLLVTFFLVFTINLGFPLNLVLEGLGLHEAAALVEEYSIGGLLGTLFDSLADAIHSSVAPDWLASLLADGIVSGVGLVLSFVPLIASVYAVFALLEDSGIAPRIAVAYDQLFRVFRMSGKAVFPLIMGLGCNVPAVMATRIIEHERERRVVAVATPMVPCQARLVVILAFTAAFFSKLGAMVATLAAIAVYLVAFAAFLVTGYIFARLLGYKPRGEYFIELPPYQRPHAKVVAWYVRSSVTHFLVRAGTVILALSVVTWLMTSLTPSLELASTPSESIAAAIGRVLSPFAQLVFGVSGETAWRLSFAMLQGLVAKEVFLDAVAMTAGEVEASPEKALETLGLTPIQAFSVLVALTLYMPCIATLATIYSETRSAKLTILALAYSLAIAAATSLLIRLLLEALTVAAAG